MEVNYYRVEPEGFGTTITFQAPNVDVACDKARCIANHRMRRIGASYRLYDDKGVRIATGDKWGCHFDDEWLKGKRNDVSRR